MISCLDRAFHSTEPSIPLSTTLSSISDQKWDPHTDNREHWFDFTLTHVKRRILAVRILNNSRSFKGCLSSTRENDLLIPNGWVAKGYTYRTCDRTGKRDMKPDAPISWVTILKERRWCMVMLIGGRFKVQMKNRPTRSVYFWTTSPTEYKD